MSRVNDLRLQSGFIFGYNKGQGVQTETIMTKWHSHRDSDQENGKGLWIMVRKKSRFNDLGLQPGFIVMYNKGQGL